MSQKFGRGIYLKYKIVSHERRKEEANRETDTARGLEGWSLVVPRILSGGRLSKSDRDPRALGMTTTGDLK